MHILFILTIYLTNTYVAYISAGHHSRRFADFYPIQWHLENADQFYRWVHHCALIHRHTVSKWQNWDENLESLTSKSVLKLSYDATSKTGWSCTKDNLILKLGSTCFQILTQKRLFLLEQLVRYFLNAAVVCRQHTGFTVTSLITRSISQINGMSIFSL